MDRRKPKMRFKLGINYWPITSAMYWWRRFDAREVDRDFALIREAGFEAVRIFLLWEDFQPAPSSVSEHSLGNLVRVADIAGQNNLSLMPTLFTGHASEVNWIPTWAIEPADAPAPFRVVTGGKAVQARLKNWYSVEQVYEAQARLAREVAKRLKGHPSIWAYDLGNENSNCVVPRVRDEGTRWLKRMAGEIRSVDSSNLITIGLGMKDLQEDRLIGPREASNVCDFLSMHGSPVYAGWAWKPSDAMVLPFLGIITRWMGNRDVLFEEFGTPTIPRNRDEAIQALRTSPVKLLNEYEAGQFTRRALYELHRFGLMGAMQRSFSDSPESLWLLPPFDEAVHERYFGLWRDDYSAKPALVEVEQMTGKDRNDPPDDLEWIDVSVDEYYLSPRETMSRLYEVFRQRFPEEQ